MVSIDRLPDLQKVIESLPKGKTADEIPEASGGVSALRVGGDDEQAKERKRLAAKEKKSKKSQKKKAPDVVEEPKDPMHMEEFYQKHETVLEELVKINGNTDKAELAYNIALTSVSEELICEQEAIISRLVADTNQASRVIRDILKGMAETTIELEKWAPPGSGDLRIRQMKEVALGQKFSRAMSRSQETQRRANTRQQEQMKRQYKIVRPDAEDAELERVGEAVGAMNLTSQQIFSISQSSDPMEMLEKMKERRKDVMDIEKGVVMLNQMFIDLENATNENGELLDNLLSYMEETIEYTGQAGGAMVDAVETQKNIRRLRCNVV